MAVASPDDGEGSFGPAVVNRSDQVILPALAYDDPELTDWVIPAGQWVRVATRDIQRAVFTIFRNVVASELRVRAGGQSVAVPFVVPEDDTGLVVRYVDFLTFVTGDWYVFSAAGETITVGTVRRL